MRKLDSRFLGAFLLLARIIVSHAASEGDFIYVLDGNYLMITRYKGLGGAVTIPETIAGKPVTDIWHGVFAHRADLTSINIPKSIVRMYQIANESTFSGCTGLTNVTVDTDNPNFSSLDGVLFNKDRSAITQYPAAKNGGYKIPDSVAFIGESAFSGCTGVTSLTTSDKMTYIGYAFDGCTSLTNVVIGNSVTEIHPGAFSRCTALTDVAISKSVMSIDRRAFSDCIHMQVITVDPLNPAYSGLNGVLFNKNLTILLKYPAARKGDYVIPNTVTDIMLYAFAGCTGLTSVSIPNGVASIREGAFEGCFGLGSVTIPSTVTLIDEPFSKCRGLTNILVDPMNSVYGSKDGVLFDKNLSALLQYPPGKEGSYVIPRNVTGIAFNGCSGLTSVTIPNTLKNIGSGAFYGCTSLAEIIVEPTNLYYRTLDGVLFDKSQATLIQFPGGRGGTYVIPSNTFNISSFAFSGSTSLTDVIFSDGLTNIADSAFSGCTGLSSVKIGKSVSGMGAFAFGGCTGLTNVGVGKSVISISPLAFDGCTTLTKILVDPLNPAYSSLDGVLFNQDQSTLVQCPAGKKGEFLLPASVTTIAQVAFQGCAGLSSITIPGTLASIGGSAFSGCTSLRSAYFEGDRPVAESIYLSATVYYRAGKTGWDSLFDRMSWPVLWMPDDDLDHDGMTNLEEKLAETDPSDPGSILAFENFPRPADLTTEDSTELENSQIALYFQSVPGRHYQFEVARALGASWSIVATFTASTTQKRVVVNRPAMTGFYRLLLQ